MASTHEIKKTDDKVELSTAQLKILVQVTRMSEKEIHEAYERLWQRFPSGCLTEEEFTRMFHESELYGNKNKKVYPAKHLFAVTDRNKSGTVDLYEYLLTMASLTKQDPSIIMKCLFQLCDSDQDGLLTQAEVVDVLYTFLQISAGNRDNPDQENLDNSLEQIKSSVAKAFDNKTQISEREFREVCEKSEEIQELAMRLHTTFMLGMLFDESDF